MEEGKFREDLYRLNTISIFIPTLRDRKEDISLLFRKFKASDLINIILFYTLESDVKLITDYNL